MKWQLFLFMFLLIPVAHAANEMTLLAVKETDDGFVGSKATLTLEIQQGQGRVLLETTPLTKADTQVSTKFAQQVACSTTNVNCNVLDFIYTIASPAPIIGGPSAGASMAVLTLASLEGVDLEKDVTLTGTINSGGIIGPVGGVKEKIDVAIEEGMNLVLIPLGTRSVERDNATIDLVVYGEEKGIEVREVGTLEEAYAYFQGKEYVYENVTAFDEEFSSIMGDVAKDLCGRAETLDTSTVNVSSLLEKANESIEQQAYYAAASRCFNANIRLAEAQLEDISSSQLSTRIDGLYEEVFLFEEEVKARELSTLAELQTYMIVMERIRDAKDLVNESASLLLEDHGEAISTFAFARERFHSAKSWSVFFEKSGKKLSLNEQRLQQSCTKKVEEARDRIQYVETIFPEVTEQLYEDVERARSDGGEGEYALCLYGASLVKARGDVLLSGGYQDVEQLQRVLDLKLNVARNNIVEEQARDVFPIASYAYVEYAEALKEESPGNALLYAQYALELSNFDPYFAEDTVGFKGSTSYDFLLVYIVGIFSGILITYIVLSRE